MLQESLGLRVEETILYGNQWLLAQEEGVYGRGKAMTGILLLSNLVLAAKHLTVTMVQVLELAINYYSRTGFFLKKEEEEAEEAEAEEARARAAEGTREGRAGAGSARAGAPERARRCCRLGAAGGGGWRAHLAPSPDILGSLRAGVRAARPETGEGGGTAGRARGGRSGRRGGAQGALRSLAPSLPRAAAAAAAAAPAAILGSLCGGGDDPGLGCRTRLPSVSPSRPTPLASSLAFPPARLPTGRLLTAGGLRRGPGEAEAPGCHPLFPLACARRSRPRTVSSAMRAGL